MKKLDNWNYDNLHGGGDFSHAYVSMPNILVKKIKIKNEYISFYTI